jgi:hypothetical protein
VYASQPLSLAGQRLPLDCGGVHVVQWPDAASLQVEARAACLLAEPRVRYAAGAPIQDLSLMDNLFIEAALERGVTPAWLWPELQRLFALASCPIDATWSTAMPAGMEPRTLIQLRVGRALAGDPDALLVDAAAWPDDVLSPARFSRAFMMQYPWRALVWATHDASRTHELRESMQELQT